MRRAAIITPWVLLLLMCAGPWITPRLLDAEEAKTPVTVKTPEQSEASPRILPTTAPTFKSTKGTPGFWRIGQTAEGVWWFVSPDNKAEFLNTVTTVQPYQHARDKDGPSFISRDYDGGYGATSGFWTTDMFIEAVYRTINAAR